MPLHDQQDGEHGWNRREKKRSWGLYLLLGSICLLLAWLLGETR